MANFGNCVKTKKDKITVKEVIKLVLDGVGQRALDEIEDNDYSLGDILMEILIIEDKGVSKGRLYVNNKKEFKIVTGIPNNPPVDFVKIYPKLLDTEIEYLFELNRIYQPYFVIVDLDKQKERDNNEKKL